MNKSAPILLFVASLLPAAAPAQEEVRFGRLFMEPGTRRQLDESREQNSSSRTLPITEEIEDVAVATLKMDGVVMRRDGSIEVWVNGERSDSQLTVKRAGGNRFRVLMPGGGEVTLKPGQIYSFESRRVIEGYEAARELALEREITDTETLDSGASAVKQEPATAPESKAGQASVPGGRAAEFDESELAEQDFRIKLEQGNDDPN